MKYQWYRQRLMRNLDCLKHRKWEEIMVLPLSLWFKAVYHAGFRRACPSWCIAVISCHLQYTIMQTDQILQSRKQWLWAWRLATACYPGGPNNIQTICFDMFWQLWIKVSMPPSCRRFQFPSLKHVMCSDFQPIPWYSFRMFPLWTLDMTVSFRDLRPFVQETRHGVVEMKEARKTPREVLTIGATKHSPNSEQNLGIVHSTWAVNDSKMQGHCTHFFLVKWSAASFWAWNYLDYMVVAESMSDPQGLTVTESI